MLRRGIVSTEVAVKVARTRPDLCKKDDKRWAVVAVPLESPRLGLRHFVAGLSSAVRQEMVSRGAAGDGCCTDERSSSMASSEL